MAEVVELTVQLLGSVLLTLKLLRWDTARLRPAMQARAWPESTMLSASVAFAPLCLLVHFTRTRRSLLGFGLGIGWAALALFAGALVAQLGSLGK
jgi:predicted membrane-bound dolichyl-phosphate-mannose-protein mannosyltransferase